MRLRTAVGISASLDPVSLGRLMNESTATMPMRQTSQAKIDVQPCFRVWAGRAVAISCLLLFVTSSLAAGNLPVVDVACRGTLPTGQEEEDEPRVPEPSVPEPKVPEPSVPEPEVPEPNVPEPEVPEPSVPEPEVPEPGVPEPENPEPGTPEPQA